MEDINKRIHTRITKHNFNKACLIGGLIAGFIGASVIFIISPASDMGYSEIDERHFREKIRIILCLLQVLLGALLGWVCSSFAWSENVKHENMARRWLNMFFIFIIAFFSIVFFRQLMVRDALVRPGHYDKKTYSLRFSNEECIADNYIGLYQPVLDSANHIKHYIRKGGGYFGEPDFESLATGLMGGIAFVIMVLKLSQLLNANSGPQRNSLAGREILLITLQSAFFGLIAWMFVYVTFLILTGTTCFIKRYDVIYARWIFVFDFPHPERYLLNFMLCGIYLFCFLFLIRSYSVPPLRLFRQKQPGLKTIKIFLASSTELSEDRKALREFISVENDRLHQSGIYLEIVQWEFFFNAIPNGQLQFEYEKVLKNCDIFLSLFYTKAGKFTMQEFDSALEQFQKTGKPYMYTYFKEMNFDSVQISKDDIRSKAIFEERLSALGHFKTTYKDTNDLLNQFKRQLEKLIEVC
ncbi:MAG: hypothetical protein WCF67_17545 [Chitinophagaceae bacterium]